MAKRIRAKHAIAACGLAGLLLYGIADAARADEKLAGSIRYSWWGGPVRTQKTNAVVDLFVTANPGVAVTREAGDFNSYWDKLSVQAAAHNQPCAISMQSRYLDQYARAGVLRPLDDLVASGAISLRGVAKSVVDTGREPDGKLYMVPYAVSSFAVVFNRSMMERAGVQAPGPDWSWADFAQIAKQAQPKLPARVKAVALLGGTSEIFFTWVLGRGEAVFTQTGLGFSKQTLIDWYRFWEDVRKAGVTQTAEVAAEVNRSIIEDAPVALGKVMIDEKPPNQFEAHLNVLAKATGDVLDMQKFPNGPAGPGELVQSNGISIGSNCNANDTKLAAALTSFWEQNDEGARIYASDNGLVAVDRQQEAQLTDATATPPRSRQIRRHQDIIRLAKPMLWPPFYNAIDKLMVRNYQAVAFGQMTIEAAVDQFFDEAAKLAKQ
ncbi:MAG: ABC transporter substrate-binding protein [Nevskiales bacterium]